MKTVFADTSYWIAVVSPHDQWHQSALSAKKLIGPCILLTTDEVLSEFLTSVSSWGPQLRIKAAQMVDTIYAAPEVRVTPQSRNSFQSGLELYRSRVDKSYSHVDCVSFVTMQANGTVEALTADSDFGAEGFTVLMQEPIA